MLAGVKPQSPVEVARHTLALEHLDDLRRLDAQMRVSKARIAEAIAASGTSLTELFGVGPVVAAMVIGYTGDVGRFRDRDHFAAYTGTAPIERSSGGRITHRLSRRGNRQLNPPHRGDHPDPLPALPGPRVLRAQGRRRQDQEGSCACAQPAHRRCRLPTAPHRRPHEQRPGRATGDDSSIQRGRLYTPTAGSSDQPLPGPNQR
jgi:hypothetical protein